MSRKRLLKRRKYSRIGDFDMRIGLVLPANILHAPYLNYYIDILKKEKIKFDVLNWNKIGIDEDIGNSEYHKLYTYDYHCDYNESKIKKMLGYFLFAKYVKKKIKKNNYDKLIVFVPQIAYFLEGILSNKYKNKYILDIRDFNGMFKYEKRLHKVINSSNKTTISSGGFKAWLPKMKQYVLSHNVDNGTLFNHKEFSAPDLKKSLLIISNIGSIRHYEINVQIIKSLSCNSNYLLRYIGKGVSEREIEDYTKNNSIMNVEFYGRYDKSDELKHYYDSDFINLIMPLNINNRTAMANRVYNACVTKRPMIASKGTYMGDIIEKYGLGIVVDIEKEDLDKSIRRYVEVFNQEKFEQGCLSFIESVQKDQVVFKKELISFLGGN